MIPGKNVSKTNYGLKPPSALVNLINRQLINEKIDRNSTKRIRSDLYC